MKNLKSYLLLLLLVIGLVSQSCNDDDDGTKVHNIDKAEKVSVDRFSAEAAHLMVRDATNGLPEANEAIDFDLAPFITMGLGPDGELVEYYNFDVQSIEPAPIYVLFREGESSSVSGQLNIVDVLPGETGYNDFWQVFKVTVPANYKANQVASLDEIMAAGYEMEETTILVNCPVVPEGSTATKRLTDESAELFHGWYKEKIVSYFTFSERSLMTSSGNVPTSPIFVCFNINPADEGGGPASGFRVETGTSQTHNVVATVPSNTTYSPLWLVSAYDNTSFENVDDLMSAENATSVGSALATVNCPIVSID